MAKVLIRFRDVETMALYDVGDEWEGSQERLKTLSDGGYIQYGLIAYDGKENVTDGGTGAHSGNLDGLTVAQLREIAESRGVDVPKRATKARLLEILGA